MLNLSDLTYKAWILILPYLSDITHIAQAFFTFIFALVLIGEALNIAQGKGFQLGSKLIVFAFVGVFVMGWQTIATRFYSDCRSSFLQPINADLQTYSAKTIQSVTDIGRAEMISSMTAGPVVGSVTSLLKGDVFTGILFRIISLLNLVACAFCYVYILTYFVSFEIVLIFAPLFIIFAISSETRSIFMGYITNIISYIIAFFTFMVVVKIINMLNNIVIEQVVSSGSGLNMIHVVPYLLQIIFVFTIIGGVGKITSGMTRSSIGGK